MSHGVCTPAPLHARLDKGGIQWQLKQEGELVAHCQQRLAAYKVPQRIEVVEALWRTASGKVIHRRERHELAT